MHFKMMSSVKENVKINFNANRNQSPETQHLKNSNFSFFCAKKLLENDIKTYGKRKKNAVFYSYYFISH